MKQHRGRLAAVGAGLLLALLLLGGIAAALLEREASFPEGSVEATVQRYEKAIADGDWGAAHALLTDELQQACPLEKYSGMRRSGYREQRVTLERSEEFGDSVAVTVKVTESDFEGPFGSSQWSYERRYSLIRDNGQWRFSNNPEPFYACPDADPPVVSAADKPMVGQ